MASGADAGFDAIPGNGVEEREEEYDGGREPEVGVEHASQGAEESNAPEYGFRLEIAVGASELFSDVEALGAEFFHCR